MDEIHRGPIHSVLSAHRRQSHSDHHLGCAVYEVGDGVVSCPLQLQENVEMRGDVVREISCDTGGADSLPVHPCEGLCARQEGRPNNSPPTVKSENKTTRRRYQEKKVKECRSKIA